MLCIRSLYLLEESRNVGIVTEADEGLGLVAGNHHVVTLILAAELVVVLHVELAAGMALYAHIAGGMIGVIPVEADGEIALVLVDAGLPHQADALLVDKGAVVDVEKFCTGLDLDTDFHGNEVEHPCGITHLFRKTPEFLHIGSAPYAFQVAGLGAERILDELGADFSKGGERHHLQFCRVIVQHVPVQFSRCKQLLAQLHGVFKVTIVAAADGAVYDACVLLAKIGIFSGADTQHAVFGRDVKEDLDVVQVTKALEQGAVAIYGHNLAGGLCCGNVFPESIGL